MSTKQEIDNAIKEMVGIGFCQPKFYLPTVWKYADKMMKRGIEVGVVVPHDFGWGKGRYATADRDMSIPEVVAIMRKDSEARKLGEKYDKYLDKLSAKTGNPKYESR